ncbi:MAG TPA: arginine--tRNA ligase [Bacteroidia bacterium]|nr:arginine--tRNA ligase [Bacteroidia bacterium]
MKGIEHIISEATKQAIAKLYNAPVEGLNVIIQGTRKEFTGDFTIVVFPFLTLSKKNPEQTAKDLGEYLKSEVAEIEDYNVIKGFLNLVVRKDYWINFLKNNLANKDFGLAKPAADANTVMVEYSSPNTNKPLHLGHVRNNLLGFSISRVLEAAGNKVIKVNLVNDRGIHICKSMLAWMKWGKGETPESSGMKGDHLVGKYYVIFDKQYKEELKQLLAKGMSEEDAEMKSELMGEAREMLRKWEAGDKATIDLWKKMNDWVYAGFDVTYKMMGVGFDKTYYESQTYLLGKEIVNEGLQKGVFFKKPDGSVWIDLTADGLDEKLVLRSDGTSVYMTQDLGTAISRADEFKFNGLVYIVGNEQEYHFKVLFLILKKLGYAWASGCYHLAYGMVELPDGKMKSREGTVVDADDLMGEMVKTAEEITKELGKIENFESEEAKALYKTIGLGALKYFILKVDPKKKMLFNPRESIDFEGNTGPFIQYTYARICSLLRKASESGYASAVNVSDIVQKEKDLIIRTHEFSKVIGEAAANHNPALIANYVYELVKEFNQFYHDYSVLKEEDEAIRSFRIALSAQVGKVLHNGMWLLGIDVPERM